ncbi:MAG: hypothetical protein KF745_03290 [Phycisphaeraceae bacterium]|nr:hypothetical protein [Phycisphaeraceae bacterium]
MSEPVSGRVLGNVEVAILTKLNELAERHGLSPLDIAAEFHGQDEKSKLVFYTLPQEAVPLERFERMMQGLGITDRETLHITGTEQQVYDTIQWAIEKAPRRVR